MSLIEGVSEEYKAAFAEFRSLPGGAWVMERLVVENNVLNELPTRRPATGEAFSMFEQGIFEGRRQLAIEILDLFQASIQDAYESINRVGHRAKGGAGKVPFAES